MGAGGWGSYQGSLPVKWHVKEGESEPRGHVEEEHDSKGESMHKSPGAGVSA